MHLFRAAGAISAFTTVNIWLRMMSLCKSRHAQCIWQACPVRGLKEAMMKTVSFPSGATATTFPLPPATFHPLTADDRTLAQFGLPARPAGAPALLEKWTLHMTHSQHFIEPTFVRVPGKRHE